MRNQAPPLSPGSAPKPVKAKTRAPEPPKNFEPPEDSAGIRLVAFLMALLCICVGVAFVNTEIYLDLLYIIFAIGGSYLSYSYRMHKNNWQSKVVIGGIILVGINCWRELGAGLELGDLSFYTPIVHFVAGTFVVQTFELRTRSDINTSQLVGLILLCIVAPLAKSVLFGACTLLYITLGAILLYYDCISRSAQSWIVKPIKQIKLEPTRLVAPKFIHGSPAFAIAVLPLASILFFFLIPRADGLIDSATTYLRSLRSSNNTMVQMPPLPQDQKPSKWKPREKKIKENVVGRGKPNKIGAHDDDNKVSGGQKNGKPGSPKTTAAKRPNKDKADVGEKLSSTSDPGSPAGKDTANAATGTGTGVKKQGHTANGDKGKVTPTAKEELISYDDQMPIQQELNNSNELLIKIKSNRTAYLRMFVFDTFDGFVWTASDSEADTAEKPTRGDIKVGDQPSLQLPSNFPAVELIQDYSIEHDLSRNIPVTWVPQALSPNLKKISVDNYGAIRLQDGDLKKGMQFKVISSFPVYNLPSMRNDQPLTEGDEEQIRSRMPQYLQLPDDVPPQAQQIAEQVTNKLAANWYIRAEALAQYLQKNYAYTFAKVDSENPLQDFLLTRKSGDCKDFATVLAVLTRSVGIPSRVIAGFAPGDFNALSGAREVRSKHRHVWTEIYIPKYGWVPFDATPQGYLPDKPREKSYDIVALQESMQGSEAARSASEQARPHKRHIVTTLDIIVWLVDALAIGAVGYFVFVAIRNALRKRRDENQRAHPARKYLKRVEAALKKWKIEKEPSDTGTELGARVRGAVADRRRLALPHNTEVPTWVEEFMEHYDAAYFGNKDRIHDLEQLSTKITSTIAKSSGGGAARGKRSKGEASQNQPTDKTKLSSSSENPTGKPGDASAAVRPPRDKK
jgi:hypothetical protein